MVKKDCFHCIHFRPAKGNICSITRNKINEYHSYCCKEFNEDPIVLKLNEEEEVDWDVREQNKKKKIT